MSYFDYLKNYSYNVIKKDLIFTDKKIDKFNNDIHYIIKFNESVNLVKINIPKIYKNCMMYFNKLSGFMLDLCTLEYINNNNLYIRNIKFIEIIKPNINYTNSEFDKIERIQIEYTTELLKITTEIRSFSSTLDKIYNLDKVFIIINKKINNHNFIHKYHDTYTNKYLYQIDLESLKREISEDSMVYSYLNNLDIPEYNITYLNTMKILKPE
jgi:hypothetical protein